MKEKNETTEETLIEIEVETDSEAPECVESGESQEALESADSIPESIEDQLDRLAKSLSKHRNEEYEVQEGEVRALETEGVLITEEEIAAEVERLKAESSEDVPSESLADSTEDEDTEIVPPTALSLDIAELQSSIEALLFLSDRPISADRLQELLGTEFDHSLFNEAVQGLQARYSEAHHGIELAEVGGGYQFRTKPGRANLAKKLVKIQTQRLSGGALETLAITAYQQPVMKEDIDRIRGVDSSYFIRMLLDRKLIRISGRSELPGRPMVYSTTQEFLEVFGLKDLSSLPSLRELEQMVPGSETRRPDEEDPKIRDMRRMISEMRMSRESALYFNPQEDEKILKDIREQINAVPTSTPYLDELKAAEALAAKGEMSPTQVTAEPQMTLVTEVSETVLVEPLAESPAETLVESPSLDT